MGVDRSTSFVVSSKKSYSVDNIESENKMKRPYLLGFVFVLLLCVSATPLSARGRSHRLRKTVAATSTVTTTSTVTATSTVTGTSTAALITQGEYEGWYRYDISIKWKTCANLYQLDLLLKSGCAEPDHEIVFPAPAGFSTSAEHPYDPLAMTWTAYFESNGCPSIFFKYDPVIEYDKHHRPRNVTAGKIGRGTFSFYSNIVPEYGTYQDVIIAQPCGKPNVFGRFMWSISVLQHYFEPHNDNSGTCNDYPAWNGKLPIGRQEKKIVLYHNLCVK